MHLTVADETVKDILPSGHPGWGVGRNCGKVVMTMDVFGPRYLVFIDGKIHCSVHAKYVDHVSFNDGSEVCYQKDIKFTGVVSRQTQYQVVG
nr:hypothetical protein [uncultured Desulfobacter sp.]